MNPADCQFLAALAPPDPAWRGMGALPLNPDSRDYSMRLLPGVEEILAAGGPQPVDLSGNVQQIYDQGAEPSCVAFSTCGLTSTEDFMGDRSWDMLDGHTLYRELGGNGRDGIDSRATLERVRSQGAPLLSGAGRVRIGSYVFASQTPGQFRQEIAAAIALGHLCTVALLLPSNFGWTSSGSITQGYHQVVACGFTGLGDADYAIICNSWGAGWGQRGFGRIPWAYLEQNNLQNHYVYAFAVTPLVLPNPNPQPQPSPTPTPMPTPTPVDLRIDGVIGTSQAVAASAPGETFRVTGQGFGAGVVQARIGNLGCPVNVQNDGLLIVTAPAQPGCAPLWVRREGVEVKGPTVVVTEGSGPQPDPGPTPQPSPTPLHELNVLIQPPQRLSASRILLQVSVTAAGAPAACLVTVLTDTAIMGQHRAGPNGQTSFLVNAGAGTALTVEAVDGQGRKGTGTITV